MTRSPFPRKTLPKTPRVRFERDSTVSAAVVDPAGKLMGRLTIDEIVDVVYEETDTDLRRMGGLSAEEDVFAPVTKAVKPAGHGWPLISVPPLSPRGSLMALNIRSRNWWRWPR